VIVLQNLQLTCELKSKNEDVHKHGTLLPKRITNDILKV
jgi:hypothetical protein